MRRFISLLVCAAFLGAPCAQAEAPAPFPEFKAKRIKPPKAGERRRITVQIDPADQWKPKPKKKTDDAKDATPAAVAAAPDGSITPLGRYAWFWERISPRLAAAGPGRLDPALIRIANPPQGYGVLAPRLQQLQDIARARGSDILLHTVGTQVSPALVLAVIAVESAGRADAVSSAGASGLMQLMPATAARFGVVNRLSPRENIRGGIAYLDWLMGEFKNDPIMVLASYNAGEGNVRKHDGVPPFAETRDYVPKVLAAFKVASGLCTTPPELISDGCVFTFANGT